MAMVLDPRLSPHAPNANAVDYIQLRTLMEEHFRSFPDGCVLASENVNISEICTHIAEHRICPSLFYRLPVPSSVSPRVHPAVRPDPMAPSYLDLQRLSRDPRYPTEAGRWPAQFPIAAMHMRVSGRPQNNSHGEHWCFAQTHTTLAYFTIYSPLQEAHDPWSASAPPQHYKYSAHNLFSQSTSGVSTDIEPISHNLPLTQAIFPRFPSSVHPIGQPSTKNHTATADPPLRGGPPVPPRLYVLSLHVNKNLHRTETTLLLANHQITTQGTHGLTPTPNHTTNHRRTDGDLAIANPHQHHKFHKFHHHQPHYITMSGVHTPTQPNLPSHPPALIHSPPAVQLHPLQDP